ncbi:internal scaffolding protein [Microviridae sp.]|nr:internal scaffolding protein [Microviridae sp.]
MTRKHSITFTEPSRTQQHQKDETDINKIMKRYIKTGVIDHINKHQGVYTNCPGMDYHEAMTFMRQAEGQFLELPSQVRKQFDNDPGKFLDFVDNPDNIDKLREMGLTLSKAQTSTEVTPSTAPAQTGKPDESPQEPATAS